MSLEKLKAFLSLMEKISPSSCNTVAVIVKYQQEKAFSQEIDVLFQTLLSSDSGALPQSNKRRSFRNPAILDPFLIHKNQGNNELKQRLEELEVEQLKDIIAEYGLDSSRRALAWKKSERLIELIVKTVNSRARKGDVFR